MTTSVPRVSFTAIYEAVEDGWTQARIVELPGVITAAPSLNEAKELLADALREYLLALQDPEGVEVNGKATRGAVEVVIQAA